MNDRELQYVAVIAKEKNITHAAEKLHISQPSLTQALKKIENELGCPLFVRRKYGLDLTPAGKLYVEMAEEVLARIDTFHEEIGRLINPVSGRLTIGASWYNTLLLLSEVIQQMSIRYPSVELALVEKGTGELTEMFLDGSVDMILTHEYPSEYSHPKRQLSKDIVQEVLLKEPFCIAAHKKFGLQEVCDLHDLDGLPFISFNETQRICRITKAAFEQAGVNVRTVVRTQSFPGALDLAARGVGFAVLPEYYVRRNIGNKPVLQCCIISQVSHAYWSVCVWYRAAEYSDLIREVLSVLYETAARLEKDGQQRF
ncbi:MAG: LysR family transcriptional regulator [Solobacterium sp.]|nr:LysR family transcriptional regulator [Solobacterium sp.]